MNTRHPPTVGQTHFFTNRTGLSLAADVGGDPQAVPIVLLHGGGQTRHSWRRTFEELVSRGYRVISLDARGHGASDWASDDDYQMETLSRDLNDVIATLPQKPIILVHATGGMTAVFAGGLAHAESNRQGVVEGK